MRFSSRGQFIPGNSLIHQMDARVKLFAFILLVVIILLPNTFVGYAVSTTAVLISNRLADISLLDAMEPMIRIWPFCAILFVMNSCFFASEDPIFSCWIVTISVDGMRQGFAVVFRLAMILAASSIFTMTTSPIEIMSATEFALKPLSLLKLPSEEIAMILSVAMQFIPVLMQEADAIKKAQTARGASFESGKLLDRAKSLIPLLVPIFIDAFKRADELSIAMVSRGYRGARFQTPKSYGAVGKESVIVLIVCVLICALLIAFRIVN